MKIKNNKILKAKRIVAYILDSAAISLICGVSALFIMISELQLFSLAHTMYLIFGVFITCVYYTYFWHYSDSKSTLGQKICSLEINRRATIKQCIKRMLFMNIGAIFYCTALLYANIIGAELHLKSRYLLVTMLCTIAMQLIYPIFIKRIDAVTGIRVAEEK